MDEPVRQPGEQGPDELVPGERLDPRVDELGERADRLRRWAEQWPGPLAAACRRRAAELDLVVTVLEPLVDELGPRPGARVRLFGEIAG